MGNKQSKKKEDNKNKKDNYKPPKEFKKETFKLNISFVDQFGIGINTSLIKKIMGDKFIDGRIVQRLILEKDNKEIRLYLFDSFGIVDNADFIIFLYDITNEQSFEKIKDFYYENKKHIKTNLIYLLGNKIDLKNEIKVSETDSKNFANSENIKYFSISFEDDINVQNFIEDLKSTIDDKFKDDMNKRMNDKLTGNPIQKKYKVVFLGESGIGSKTTLIKVITGDGFNPDIPTSITPSYASKSFMSKNKEEIIFDFWDTPGQGKYRKLSKILIVDSDVIILGF